MLTFFRLLVWGTVWIPIWLFNYIYRKITKTPQADNCLSWAVRRWDEEGGYLVIRWSRSARFKVIRWPHFAWLAEDNHHGLQHYVPVIEDNMTHVLPQMWFHGHVRTGDPKDTLNEN